MGSFCRECGSALKEDNKFCPRCGKPVAPSGHVNPPAEQAVQPLPYAAAPVSTAESFTDSVRPESASQPAGQTLHPVPDISSEDEAKSFQFGFQSGPAPEPAATAQSMPAPQPAVMPQTGYAPQPVFEPVHSPGPQPAYVPQPGPAPKPVFVPQQTPAPQAASVTQSVPPVQPPVQAPVQQYAPNYVTDPALLYPQTAPARTNAPVQQYVPYQQAPLQNQPPAKKKVKGWLIAVIIAAAAVIGAVLILMFTGVFDRNVQKPTVTPGPSTEVVNTPRPTPTPEPTKEPEPTPVPLAYEEGTWTICMYLCGSNLERECYFTSDNLYGIASAKLPDNVNVIAQTGGGRGLHLAEYGAEEANDRKLQRWKVNQFDFELVDEMRLASMGDPDTLEDFLRFCTENYPAEHIVVILQNHGGTGALCYDELYGDDPLTLAEIHDAFSHVFELSNDTPPVDLIYFNSCLMGTIDSCITLRDVSHYFLASEDEGWTWDYSGAFDRLAGDPSMSVETFGRGFVDEYAQSFVGHPAYRVCETMALVDLTKADDMIGAYHDFGAEILREAVSDNSCLTRFCANAEAALPLGPESDDEGYFDQLDLGSLAAMYADTMPSARELLSAIDDCVVVFHHGPYHKNGCGIGCYYPFDYSFYYADDYYTYTTRTADSDCFYYLYQYALTGELDDRAWDLMRTERRTVAQPMRVEDIALENLMLNVTEDGTTYLELDPHEMNAVKSASLYVLVYIQDNMYLMAGGSDDVIIDRENNLLYDTLSYDFLTFNDDFSYMTFYSLIYRDDEIAKYELIAEVNGQIEIIHVVYSYETGEYELIGYQDFPDDDVEYAQANPIIPFKNGDRISGENVCLWIDDFSMVNLDILDTAESFDGDVFIYDEDSTFLSRKKDWGDEVYYFFYEIEDTAGNYVYSNYARAERKDDVLYVSTIEPKGW